MKFDYYLVYIDLSNPEARYESWRRAVDAGQTGFRLIHAIPNNGNLIIIMEKEIQEDAWNWFLASGQ